MEQKRCPRCNYVLAIDAKYCLNCGYSFVESTYVPSPPQVIHRSGMLIAAGVLLILGSVTALIDGLYRFILFGVYVAEILHFPTSFLAFIIAVLVFEIIGFAFGLAAGVQSLRKKKFSICIAGAVLLLVAGVLYLLYYVYVIGVLVNITNVLTGMSMIIPAVLGLIFLALRKREFR